MQLRHQFRRRFAVDAFPSRERLPLSLLRGCFLQGDQSIANQAGAAFRSDLNTELQAMVRGSDGSTAPATTYPYQIWNDTNNNLRKQRNAANTGWIIRGTLAETRTFSRSSNTILGLADFGCFIRATAGFTQTLTAAATLGDGWMCFYRIDTGTVTFDPNSSENIDGAATKVVVGPSSGIIYCDGTAFYTIGLATSSGSSPGAVARNYVINGSFKGQQCAIGTTDNSYVCDGWRVLMENANGVTTTFSTSSVPGGAMYRLVGTVGSGNNGKFGFFHPIANGDMQELRSQVVSILASLKATAGISDVRIGIMQWTGTADAITADPISAWNAAGTNPTLIANWAFVNTPANLSVTTAFADYSVINQTIGGSSNNLAILIWSDDRTTTTTTDVLEIGGYVTMCPGATAPAAQVRSLSDEIELYAPYYQKTFPLGTAPAQNAGLTGAVRFYSPVGATTAGLSGPFFYPLGRMRAAPTITAYNPSAANAEVRDEIVALNCTSTAVQNISDNSYCVGYTTSGSTAVQNRLSLHLQFDARL